MEATLEQKPATKPTIRQVRVQAGLRQADLAQKADVSIPTVWRLEHGVAVSETNAWRIIHALEAVTRTTYTLDSFDGLQVK